MTCAESILPSLQIEALAYGGSGLGYHEGKVVFVPMTAPGDRVRCVVHKVKKRFAVARLERILEPSPDRCEAPCPVFGECGGCQWQYLPYTLQADWKQRIFNDLLLRQADIPDCCIRPLIAAPSPWHYRSRAQLKMRAVHGRLVMGFYRRGSHYIIDHRQCAILHPRLGEVAGIFRDALKGFRHADKIPQMDLGVGDDGGVRILLHYLGDDRNQLADYLKPVAQAAKAALFLQTGKKTQLYRVCGAEDLMIRVGDPPMQLAYGPGGFAQVNLDQNRNLVSIVVETVRQVGARQVLDLFCGMGNLTLPVAREVAGITGVEEFPQSINKARFNALSLAEDRADFYLAPAEETIARLGRKKDYDLVMLDPPRTGAYDVIRQLQRLKPRHILYVSCEPPTLARDLVPLLHNGYTLAWSRPMDFFPQTHHIESVSLLRCSD